MREEYHVIWRLSRYISRYINTWYLSVVLSDFSRCLNDTLDYSKERWSFSVPLCSLRSLQLLLYCLKIVVRVQCCLSLISTSWCHIIWCFTGSSSCMINSVDVNNCAPDAQSCDFPRGTTVKMTLKFTTSEFWVVSPDIFRTYLFVPESAANDLKSILQGEIGGTWVPFNTSDACPSITPSCPIAANTASTFELNVPISKVYPTVSHHLI